jgi:hypothetical protein
VVSTVTNADDWPDLFGILALVPFACVVLGIVGAWRLNDMALWVATALLATSWVLLGFTGLVFIPAVPFLVASLIQVIWPRKTNGDSPVPG